ncbi:uncharacterized protein STEHIDRAFT_114441 [Stereum hirsutum FP-91666 SS1]|uniref:uncharacterized protein n=1 Tax=Stereum hirsutum (strain FP-91666) TaxID=721885 RepID=UPI0004449B1E|nr:uncharacterized protein STEHIDRAFT_114441 [Stereum hirsutum FP-91666 SS1]EIM82546.1 hypothetical protein STEHIDRAFT_114441 [Stereum hirsutum FP-91666 SS1]
MVYASTRPGSFYVTVGEDLLSYKSSASDFERSLLPVVLAFYVYRIYVLGKKRRLYVGIICVIFLASVTQAIASIYVGVKVRINALVAIPQKLFEYHSLDQWHIIEVPIGIWNVGSTIADVLIAGCMVFLLSCFKNDTINRGQDATGDILNRLIRRSVESGAMTALIVILDTAVIYGQPNTTLFLVLYA